MTFDADNTNADKAPPTDPTGQGSVDDVGDGVILEACPWCGYALHGLPVEHQCPECGIEIDRRWTVVGPETKKYRKGVVFAEWVGNIAMLVMTSYVSWEKKNAIYIVALAIVLVEQGWRRHRLRRCFQPFVALGPRGLFLYTNKSGGRTIPWKDLNWAKFSRFMQRVEVQCIWEIVHLKVRAFFRCDGKLAERCATLINDELRSRTQSERNTAASSE